MRGVRIIMGLPGAAARGLFVWDKAAIGDRGTHIMYLVIFSVLVSAPFLMTFDPAGDGRVVAGSVRLPGLCLSQELLHQSCPGCQLTRSFVLAAHGQWRESIRFHRLGLVLYAFFAGQIAVRAYYLHRGARPISPWLLAANHYLAVITIALLLGNWAVGLFVGGNGS
jgi:hypothetical protein